MQIGLLHTRNAVASVEVTNVNGPYTRKDEDNTLAGEGSSVCAAENDRPKSGADKKKD